MSENVFSLCAASPMLGEDAEEQSICLGLAAIPCSAVRFPHNYGQIPLPPWGLRVRQHTWLCAKATGLRVVKCTWTDPDKTQLPAELRGVQASEKAVAKLRFQVVKCQEWGSGTGGVCLVSQLYFIALCSILHCALPVPGLALVPAKPPLNTVQGPMFCCVPPWHHQQWHFPLIWLPCFTFSLSPNYYTTDILPWDQNSPSPHICKF